MTPENAWVYAILPFLTMAALTAGLVVVFRQRAASRRVVEARPAPAAPLQWGRRKWVGLAIVLIALLLGVFVWPGFFALALIAVPVVVWQRRPWRRPKVDPRTNGHAHRDGGAFTSE